MANTGNVVGIVSLVEGQAFARGADGKARALKVGDQVFEGEVIVTGENSRVELSFDDGHKFLLRAKENVTLDSAVIGSELPDAKDAALLEKVNETVDITRAIAEGSSLDDLLEETAAVLSEGGGVDVGHGFVYLMRIAEGLAPPHYEYGFGSGAELGRLRGGDEEERGRSGGAGGDTVAIDTAPPTPTIVLAANITADDIINAAEAAGSVAVTGTVTGARDGDTVTLTVNGIAFTGAVSGGAFSINVTGAALTADADLTIDASVLATDAAGNSATAIDTETYSVDTTAPGVGLQTFSYNENQPAGAVVATVVATDNVAVSSFTFAATGTQTSADGYYQIDNSGNITITAFGAASAMNDFETGSNSGIYSVTAHDAAGNSTSAAITLNELNVNDNAPTNVVPGVQSTSEDTAQVFSVANGNAITVSDVDGGTLTTMVSISNGTLTAVTGGGATISNNGTGTVTIQGTAAQINAALNGLSYAPTADWNGSATLTVQTSDGTLTDTDTVAIAVDAATDIVADAVSTNEDTAITFNAITGVGGGSADNFENAGRAVTAVTQGANGTVSFLADGSITYTPNANWNGTDSFTYTVSSGGVTETATVNVTVNAVNDLPTIQSVTNASVTEGGDLVHTVTLSNASSVATSFAFSLAGNTASAGDFGAPSFSNGVTLAAGNLSVPAGVTSFTVTYPTSADTTDEADETVDLSVGGVAAVGTIVDNDNAPTIQSVTNASVTEGGDLVHTVTLSNASSVATSFAFSLAGNTASAGDFGAPSFSNGVTLAAGNLSVPAGVTSFTVTYTTTPDSAVESDETVDLTVGGVAAVGTILNNDYAPAANPVTVAGNEDTVISITLSGSDVDGTIASFSVTSLPTTGRLYRSDGTTMVGIGDTIPAGDATLKFVPFTEFAGSVTFNYTATDNDGGISTPALATINVTAVNDGTPVAANDSITLPTGTTYFISKESLLGNDTLFDNAAISGNTNPAAGTLTPVYDGGGALTGYNYTPAGPGTYTFTYTITDNDQPTGQSSTATVTLTVVNATDDFATVSESALPEGSGGGAAVATGNLFATGGEAASDITQITYNAVNYTPTAGVITITTTTGTLVVQATGASRGNYTYTLNSAAVNGAPGSGTDTAVVQDFTYTKADATSATLHVTVADDKPVATNMTVEIAESPTPSYNLLLTVDLSGSMTEQIYGGWVKRTNDDGTTEVTTRLQMAQDALVALVTEFFNQSPDVRVSIVAFADSATALNGGAPYTSLTAAVNAINNLSTPANDGSATTTANSAYTGPLGSGTNYEAALDTIRATMGSGSGSAENIAYFISDGEPTGGDVTINLGTAGDPYNDYVNWLATNPNPIKSYAVGIGTGISDTSYLDIVHNVDVAGDGIEDRAIMVPDLNNLAEQLISTVPQGFGGNVLLGSGAQTQSFGADGGYVQSIVLELDSNADDTPDTTVTFTYDGSGLVTASSTGYLNGNTYSGHVLTLDDTRGFAYGTLVFDFATGDYTYFTGNAAQDGDEFTLTSTARDGDGDLATSVQNISVVNGKPEANDDTDTLSAKATFLEGNVVTGVGTDAGIGIGDQFTAFTVQGTGVDKVVDNAAVTSVDFRGQPYVLGSVNASGVFVPASSSGSGAGYSYTVSGGTLTWTATSGGEQLVFDQSGYYKYTPPTAAVPSLSAAPTLDVSNISVTEGVTAGVNPNAVFMVSLSSPATAPVTVSLSLTAGTAGLGTDYQNALQVSTDRGLTWSAAGATSATIAAGTTFVLVRTPIVNDAVAEAATENFTLTATRTAGVTANASATGTAIISDDEAAVLPTLSVADVQVNEAAGTATVTVSLSKAAAGAVTVNYATADGTATTADSDYTATSGTLNIAAGSRYGTFTVNITNDTKAEGPQTFLINLSSPSANATISDSQGVVTIRDDGTFLTLTPDLTVSTADYGEAAGYALFNVGLSKPSPVATTLTLALGGTATGGGTDYGTLQVSRDGATWTNYATNVVLEPGETQVFARVAITSDATAEANETIILTANRAAGAGLTTNASASATATIIDDEAKPILTISDAAPVVEGGVATFSWTLSAASGTALTVNWTTAGGTATSGTDFTAVTAGTFNIGVGVTSGTFTVTTLANATGEVPVEAFTVNATLAAASTQFARVGDGRATGYIVDSAASADPTIEVSNPTVVEGAGYAVYAINLSHAAAVPVTLNLALGGTATAGTDYTNSIEVWNGSAWVTGTAVTIAAGSTSALARVAILTADGLDNGETVTLTATNPTPSTTTNASDVGTATIVDERPFMYIVDAPPVVEGNTITYTVALSQASATAINTTIAYSNTAPAGMTAAAGGASGSGNPTDYYNNAPSSMVSLNIAAGATTGTFTVGTRAAQADTDTEAFLATLSLNAANSLLANLVDSQGYGYILDAADTGVALLVSDAVVAESATHTVFDITLSARTTTTGSLTLGLTLGGTATGGTDYTNAIEVRTWDFTTNNWSAAGWTTYAGSLVIPQNSTATATYTHAAAQARIALTGDTAVEANETITLTAARTAGIAIINTQAPVGTAIIVDDEARPMVSIDDATPVLEGGMAVFTVHLSQASAQDITLNWSAAGGTATAGTDFTAMSGTLTIAAGQTSGTLSVPTLADTAGEAMENFTVTLSLDAGSANLATIGDATATGYVVDSIAATAPTFIVSNPSVAENAGYAVFQINLSRASDAAVALDLALAGGTATAGTDFTNAIEVWNGSTWVAGSSVTIAAGATNAQARVAITPDASTEDGEAFQLTATRTAGLTNNTVASGTAIIVGDVAAMPVVNVSDVRVEEATGTATITIRLSQADLNDIKVDWSTADGTAVAGTDYTAGSGTVTIAAGQTSATFTVALTNDALAEATETVLVNLAMNALSAGLATLGKSQGTVSIEDVDANLDVNVVSCVTDPAANGITLSALDRFNAAAPVQYNATGASVNAAGGTAANIDYLESLVISFSQATYALGVQNVVLNLGVAPVDPYGYTYTIYGRDGELLGRVSSVSQTVIIPADYGYIGQIVMQAASPAGVSSPATLGSVTFSTVQNNAAATVVPVVEVGYTLTDATGDASSATLQLNLVTNKYFGTAAAETLSGSAGNDGIFGADGNDSLSGLAGNDILQGEAGDDTLSGGDDNDILSGGIGNDALQGDAGADTLRGNEGSDTLTGGTGDDRLEGGAGTDSLSGGSGADTLLGGAGNDTLSGGLGDTMVDVFKWELADRGFKGTPAIDTVTDFDTAAAGAGGDVLDLRDLLVGESHPTGAGNLANFLHFEYAGGDTKVHISTTGAFGGGFSASLEDQTIVLQGVDLIGTMSTDQQIIQDLLNKNKLITD
jgi:hypothetical protein